MQVLGTFWSSLMLYVLLGLIMYAVIKTFRRKGNQKNEPAEPDYEAYLCPGCGYDLRATPSRCPECGMRTFDRRSYLRALANDWPANPISVRAPSAAEERIDVLQTGDGWEADLLRQQLLARGVACLVTAPAGGVDIYGTKRSPVFSVSVYAADLELAQAYLDRLRGWEAEKAAAATEEHKHA